MDLTQLFDDVVVISLGRPRNNYLLRYKVLQGIVPTDKELKNYTDEHRLHGWNFQESDRQIVGNRLAHIIALRFARHNALRNILVLEDDCCFVENYQSAMPNVARFLSANAWALFFLGGKHYVNTNGHPDSFGFPGNYHAAAGEGIVRTKATYGTHAVAYNLKYYDELMYAYDRKDLLPVDHCLCGLPIGINDTFEKRHPCYAINPLIAWQDGNFSKEWWFEPTVP